MNSTSPQDVETRVDPVRVRYFCRKACLGARLPSLEVYSKDGQPENLAPCSHLLAFAIPVCPSNWGTSFEFQGKLQGNELLRSELGGCPVFGKSRGLFSDARARRGNLCPEGGVGKITGKEATPSVGINTWQTALTVTWNIL